MMAKEVLIGSRGLAEARLAGNARFDTRPRVTIVPYFGWHASDISRQTDRLHSLELDLGTCLRHRRQKLNRSLGHAMARQGGCG